VNVKFTPKLPNQDGCVPSRVECESFGLAYLTLEPCDQSVDGKVDRKHQYDIEPLRLDMTGTIQPAIVSLECHDDDECLSFHVVASDLLMDCTPTAVGVSKESHLYISLH